MFFSDTFHKRFVRGVNAWVCGLADLAFLCTRIADSSDKLRGFTDLRNNVDRGSAENVGPDSGLCLEVRIVDRNINFRSGLGEYLGVLSNNFFQFQLFGKLKERSERSESP